MRSTASATLAFVFALQLMGADAPKPAATLGQVFDHQLSVTEKEVVSLAEAMPSDKYDFAPTQGAFTGVRTFAKEVLHIGATNYSVCATALGEKPPADTGKDEAGPALTSKDQIVAYLKGSFTYCHKAEQSLTTTNELDMVVWAGDTEGHKTPRITAANIAIWHPYDHYGQMVEYARMNGIIPPASRPQ